MKKKILITSILLTIISFTFAQNKPSKNFFGIGIDYKLQRELHVVYNYAFFPDDGYGGVDYRIESYNYFPALKFDYFLGKGYSLNLFFRPSVVNNTKKTENISPHKYQLETTINRFSMDIGLGAEKHFFKKLKIDPFVGINAHYLYSGKDDIKKDSKIYEYNENFLRYTYDETIKGVETHGLYYTVNLGLNYFISKHFSLGINLDGGQKFTFQKGTATSSLYKIEYDVDGNEIANTTTENKKEINNSSNAFIYSFSIKSSFYFPLTKKKEPTN